MHFFLFLNYFQNSPPQVNWTLVAGRQCRERAIFIIIVSRKRATKLLPVLSQLVWSFNGIVILGVPFNVANVNTVNIYTQRTPVDFWIHSYALSVVIPPFPIFHCRNRLPPSAIVAMPWHVIRSLFTSVLAVTCSIWSGHCLNLIHPSHWGFGHLIKHNPYKTFPFPNFEIKSRSKTMGLKESRNILAPRQKNWEPWSTVSLKGSKSPAIILQMIRNGGVGAHFLTLNHGGGGGILFIYIVMLWK